MLYLHDGQNVFSSAGPNACFGWGNWELDKTVDGLCASNQMRDIIMVGVDNSRFRYQEYRGPSAAGREASAGGTPKASQKRDRTRFDDYSDFLAKELKPKIDGEYRTLKGASSTATLGSSLGGICSLAVTWGEPKTFGAAASLSGSFQIEKGYFLQEVLRRYRGKAKPVRFYLDSGSIDFTGDDDGRKDTEAVAAELRRIGWREGKSLKHFVEERTLTEGELERIGLRRDKWQEAQSSQHNEFYWRLRVWRALTFLFPPVR